MKYGAAIAAMTVLTTMGHASLLTNGSFELPGSNAWNHFSNGQVPGWYTEGGQVMEIGMPVVYGVAGADGRNVLELDSTSNVALSQTVNLAAGVYDLSFLYAKRGLNLENRPGNTCDFDVLWNHALVASYSPLSSTFARQDLLVTATAGFNTVTFRAMGASDGMGALLDDVRLESVPEPASLGALGVSAAAILRRKRRAARPA